MNSSENEAITVFRKWRKDKTIIALFPEQEGAKVGLVGSFEHIGQHGDADYYDVLSATIPAKPKEYGWLQAELEHYYEYNLKVVKRGSQHLWWRRKRR